MEDSDANGRDERLRLNFRRASSAGNEGYAPDPFLLHDSTTYLTSKYSYYWAIITVIIAERNTKIDSQQLFYDIVSSIRSNQSFLYKSMEENIPRPGADYEAFLSIYQSLLKRTNISEDVFGSAQERADKAYQGLLNKGLIEDPVGWMFGGVGIAVIGMIPVGFTRKTRRGRMVSLQIRGMIWDYQYSREKGETKHEFNFRLVKLLKAMKQGLVKGWEAMSETWSSDPESKKR